jgi:hypothetical protein
LRRADAEELQANSGRQGEEALLHSMQESAMSWTFLHPRTGRPQTMAGLGWMQGCDSIAIPWVLGAELDRQAAGVFCVFFPSVWSYLHQFRPILMNMVDVRNEKAVRRLIRAGFILLGPFVWGVERRDFYQLISVKGINHHS